MKPTIPGHEDVERMEQALFESLRRDEPPAGARRATAATLGLGTAALTSATAGAQAGATIGPSIAPTVAKVGPFLLVKWAGIGTLAAAVSVGAVHYATFLPWVDPPKPAATMMRAANADGTSMAAPQRGPDLNAVVPVLPAQVPPSVASRETTEPSVRQADGTLAAVPQRGHTSRARSANELPIESTTGPSSGAFVPSRQLAGEVAMLDQARSAFVAGDGERTLDLLGRYSREFPGAVLNHEATLLRIEALFLTGSPDAASSLGREFLATYPNSTHASRVRRLLAEHPKP
jgi:hypothetical protein